MLMFQTRLGQRFPSTSRLSRSNPGRTFNEKKNSTVIQILVLQDVLAAGFCLEQILPPSSLHCSYQKCRGTQHGLRIVGVFGSAQVATYKWSLIRPELGRLCASLPEALN